MNVVRWPIATEREPELLREVLESESWGGFHPFVERFEQSFAKFHQCRRGIAAANGSVTLEVALQSLGIVPGDEVIVPAISFVATATAVSRVGATPVFVDIEEDTFQIDPERVAQAFTNATKAVIAVHFGGVMADMDRLCAFTAANDAWLIEDAAHAHGSEWNGRRAGSIGVAGSFSFQNGKVMTAGEGGILCSNDDAFAERAWSFVNQGRKRDCGWFHHYEIGSNFRMTGWQAAVLIAQLERLPEQNRTRAASERVLREELRDVPGLRLQRVPPAARVHTNYLFLGRVKQRDEFCRRLRAAGVPCTPFYPHPLYGNPVYQRGGCRVEPCPVAEACVQDAFWLPHRVLLSGEETAREVTALIRQTVDHAVAR